MVARRPAGRTWRAARGVRLVAAVESGPVGDLNRTSLTRLARQEEQRHNAERVLSESAVLGERRVTFVRLAMFLLFGISTELVSPLFGEPLVPDTARNVAVVAYLVYTVGAIVTLQRVKPSPRASMWAPMQAIVVDNAFIAFMAWRTWETEREVYPEMGVAAFALIQCFSVARFSWIHVAFSTAAAIAAFSAIGLHTGAIRPASYPFVIGGFLALGFLLGLTNLAVKRTFAGLRARDNLSRFLPRPIVDRVLAGGDGALAPVQREVTVLFSDIRDFTTLSESLPPREVLELLDEYFGHMGQIVKGHDGIVNKFLGDGMLAFWGVPDLDERHAERALRAALDMRTKLAELNAARLAAGRPVLRIGIGIHTGLVAAGMLGGADQHEYTVIGDAVNVASRVEGLTKSLGVDVLVSEPTFRAANGRFRGERLAEEKVKGRAEPVVVYSLAGRATEAAA